MFNSEKIKEYFKGKKITVMGLGLLGRGVGDAAYIAEAGAAEVIVTDLKYEIDLSTSVEKLRQYSNIKFVLGEHRKQDFENRDLVLVSAGVPLGSEFVKHARETGVLLKQSATLFAELSHIPMIGVTGTRGKSTVTQMIHHVLSFVTGERIILGGNIRGVSNLQLLREVREDSIAVFELDSWQLQSFGWSEISPQIAVFTNFMEDHLNYYGIGGLDKDRAMDLYFKDKANIFRYQEDNGTFITTPEIFERAKKLPLITFGQEVVIVDESVIPEDALLAMPGKHNRLNAALAYEALKAVGLSREEIFDGLSTFMGVEGRLEYLREIDGVKVYNDNNATTPAATIAGLTAIGKTDKKNIILIMGGADKGIDLSELFTVIAKYCKKVILIPGTGTDQFIKRGANSPVNWTMVEEVADLKVAVVAARSASTTGDIILFSPAFASFGQYKNEYERNDEFVHTINAIEV